MSDEPESQQDESSGADGPKAGERLAAARRELEITILDVAKELHLDEPKVRALERNDFEILGAPVFAKGHLRKYAQLVGVPVEDVLADYYTLNRATGAPPLVARARRPERSLSPGPWIAVIVVLLVAAAAYWYFAVRQPAQTTQPATPAEMPAMQTDTVDAASTETSVPVQEEAVDADAAPVEPAAETGPAVSEPAVSAPTPVAEGTVRLSVTFSGDCWTEISDAAGEQLFVGSGTAGRSITVEGAEPLSALFGKAENVTLEVNGVSRAILASERRGDTARMTIVAP
ncbi:MAG: DUF4115 domain-containing protein [Woeseiaceae bacterium]|nr:DUF4115 domain-containing protein [Woeseiaceae bacterium]